MTLEKLKEILFNIPSDYNSFTIMLEERYYEDSISEVVLYPQKEQITLR